MKYVNTKRTGVPGNGGSTRSSVSSSRSRAVSPKPILSMPIALTRWASSIFGQGLDKVMVDRLRQNLISAHQEWMGFVQPVGLVVAPTVMVDAQIVPDRNVAGRQRDFREFLEERGNGATAGWRARDLRGLFLGWLCWDDADFLDAGRIPGGTRDFLAGSCTSSSRRLGQCRHRTGRTEDG